MSEDELDRQLRALGPVEPPRAVQARVLAEVGVSDARTAELLGPASTARPAVVADSAGSWGGGGAPPQRPPIPAPRARRYWPVALGGLALAAAVLLAVNVTPPERADPAALVPRGDGDMLPSLGLRVAVRRGDTVERLATGQVYAPGDTLLFRVSASTPMDIVLRRGDAVLYRGSVPAGDTDLPIGYALEAGEPAARFVVEGGGTRAFVDLAEVRR